MSRHGAAGKLFQVVGPLTAKMRSLLCVCFWLSGSDCWCTAASCARSVDYSVVTTGCVNMSDVLSCITDHVSSWICSGVLVASEGCQQSIWPCEPWPRRVSWVRWILRRDWSLQQVTCETCYIQWLEQLTVTSAAPNTHIHCHTEYSFSTQHLFSLMNIAVITTTAANALCRLL